jgi:alkanesulfonate monooxygenase SsuD/methylene tetrahydromethanopterin reductase-like flavin-dependent oxidoreductase (luciferase family)
MLHTYLDEDLARARAKVQGPFIEYLRDAAVLEIAAGPNGQSVRDISPKMIDQLLELKFDWYFSNAALMGTPGSARRYVQQLEAMGVDEIACLVDFGLRERDVFDSLELIKELNNACARDVATQAASCEE